MFGRVSVKLGRIFGNLLPQLLFLEFPNVQLLISILEDIDSVWDIHALLKRSSRAHGVNSVDVRCSVVFWWVGPSLVEVD